jgi:ribosomal protein S18 acetylase RimI-like enzyme
LSDWGVTSIAPSTPGTDWHPLDRPAWAALTGPHARFARVRGLAARYPAEISPFFGLADDADPQAWIDLAALAGPDTEVVLGGLAHPPPAGWEILFSGQGVQMVDTTVDAAADPEAVVLGAADIPDVLDLVERTQPGPFAARTIEMGTYLGIRRDGALVAMAGERVNPPGWTEISAVCTDPAYRGQGLAGRLVRAVAAVIRSRGETPFLHASARNTNAIRLYEALGFTVRRSTTFLAARPPNPGTSS